MDDKSKTENYVIDGTNTNNDNLKGEHSLHTIVTEELTRIGDKGSWIW